MIGRSSVAGEEAKEGLIARESRGAGDGARVN